MMMEKMIGSTGELLRGWVTFPRRCLFNFISVGPIPNHIAFIMDGNRRFAKKLNADEIAGHKAGYSCLMSLLAYCFELGVQYVTAYAFSIDNFRRRPEVVQYLMDLMMEKIDGLLKHEGIVHQYGIRVYFVGSLKLLSEPIRVAAEKAMQATAKNNKGVLCICVAYSSRDEIVQAIKETCISKRQEIQISKLAYGASEGVQGDKNFNKGLVVNCGPVSNEVGLQVADAGGEKQMKLPSIKLGDIEKHMYMGVAPDPDIVIRSSGETRLSNFLLWQTDNCLLYSPAALWPELCLWHLVWAVLNFQRSYQYLEKKKRRYKTETAFLGLTWYSDSEIDNNA